MAKERTRTRQEIAADYGTKVPDIKPGQTEEQYFRQLAKAADQRLLRLERLAADENYKGVLSYAYESAMYDIKALTGNPNARRFNVAVKKTKAGETNVTELRQRISAVKKFLESPTSMKSSITAVYKKRAKSVNQSLGTNFTWQQVGRFFESKGYEKMKALKFTSSAIAKAFTAIKNQTKKADYDKALSQNIRVSKDAVVNEVANAISAEQLTINDFIK